MDCRCKNDAPRAATVRLMSTRARRSEQRKHHTRMHPSTRARRSEHPKVPPLQLVTGSAILGTREGDTPIAIVPYVHTRLLLRMHNVAQMSTAMSKYWGFTTDQLWVLWQYAVVFSSIDQILEICCEINARSAARA